MLSKIAAAEAVLFIMSTPILARLRSQVESNPQSTSKVPNYAHQHRPCNMGMAVAWADPQRISKIQ